MGGGGPGTTKNSPIEAMAEFSSTHMATCTRKVQLRVANILCIITADITLVRSSNQTRCIIRASQPPTFPALHSVRVPWNEGRDELSLSYAHAIGSARLPTQF